MAHEVFGQTARFERFAANMLYVLATRREVDPSDVEPFGKQVDEIYRNPFRTPESELTAEEIKRRVVEKLTSGR